MNYKKHETAIIDKGAKIGKDTKIWHWTHISGECEIGANCSLGQGVYVASKVKIGNNVKIQNNVSIFDSVIIEDDVFCGPSMVFTNVINPRSFIERKTEYRETLVKKGASFGANSTIVCGVTIGEYSFVAAGATVVNDVNSFALVAGVPAKQIGWMSKFGERLNLPLNGEGKTICPNSKEIYVLKNGKVDIA
tara:strand:- start:1409 stop:1984 length:576 start_codon:yes stop_codon:yes gene_type:complete